MNGGYNEDSGDEQEQFTDLIPKRQKSILTDLTDHRAERVQILIKNLANEDLVHIDQNKVPAFLRIDQDIVRKKELLQEFHDQYMNYDIDEMAKHTKRDLQNRLIEAGAEFKTHVSQVNKMLKQGDETNKNSLTLQDETIGMRVQENQNITSALDESKKKLSTFDG